MNKDSKEDAPKQYCANHPHRQGQKFTQGGAINVVLCDECTPPWFNEDE